jgi:hypothetical protein
MYSWVRGSLRLTPHYRTCSASLQSANKPALVWLYFVGFCQLSSSGNRKGASVSHVAMRRSSSQADICVYDWRSQRGRSICRMIIPTLRIFGPTNHLFETSKQAKTRPTCLLTENRAGRVILGAVWSSAAPCVANKHARPQTPMRPRGISMMIELGFASGMGKVSKRPAYHVRS